MGCPAGSPCFYFAFGGSCNADTALQARAQPRWRSCSADNTLRRTDGPSTRQQYDWSERPKRHAIMSGERRDGPIIGNRVTIGRVGASHPTAKPASAPKPAASVVDRHHAASRAVGAARGERFMSHGGRALSNSGGSSKGALICAGRTTVRPRAASGCRLRIRTGRSGRSVHRSSGSRTNRRFRSTPRPGSAALPREACSKNGAG